MKLVIEMQWGGQEPVNNPDHWDELKKRGAERIAEMMEEGYVEGELVAEVVDLETEEEHPYRGWWTTRLAQEGE